MNSPQPARARHEPVRIADDTRVIQATRGEGEVPLVVHLDSMVITCAEPVAVDTGAPIHREQYLEDLFGIVDPGVSMLDRDAFIHSARTIEQLDVTTITGAHTPTIPSTHLGQAFEMLRSMPTTPVPPMPDQSALDQMLATLHQ